MNILETLGVFVLIPAAIVGLAGLLTVLPERAHTTPKYRPGEPWAYSPRLWAGDQPVVRPAATPVAGPVGGARGTW